MTRTMSGLCTEANRRTGEWPWPSLSWPRWWGSAFAAVPLYRLFCQVTGYGGTTQVAETLRR